MHETKDQSQDYRTSARSAPPGTGMGAEDIIPLACLLGGRPIGVGGMPDMAEVTPEGLREEVHFFVRSIIPG